MSIASIILSKDGKRQPRLIGSITVLGARVPLLQVSNCLIGTRYNSFSWVEPSAEQSIHILSDYLSSV